MCRIESYVIGLYNLEVVVSASYTDTIECKESESDSEYCVIYDLPIGSFNWASSADCSIYVSTWVVRLYMNAGTSPRDSDGPKDANI